MTRGQALVDSCRAGCGHRGGLRHSGVVPRQSHPGRWLVYVPSPRCPSRSLPAPAQHTDQHDRFPEEAALMDEAPYYAEAFSPITGRFFRLVSRPCSGWPYPAGGSWSRRSSPCSCGATRPSMRRSRWRRGAGLWSWAGSSSGAGLPRMAAPDQPWRSWPRSWGQAFAGLGDGDDDQGDAQPEPVASSTGDAGRGRSMLASCPFSLHLL